MSYAPNRPMMLDTDNAVGDAFGRLRVSQPLTLFDSKQILDNQPFYWESVLESGAGISDAWVKDEAATTITSTASTAGLFTRRMRQRINYRPGKSQLVLITGVLAPTAGATGVTRRVGQFDADNGLFFVDVDGTVNVAVRSKVSGSVVETLVAQSAWNIDPMDGTGPSGVTVDWGNAQIFVVDYEWLAVGRVRFGLVVDGVTCYVHEFNHANVISGAYMSTPNLPISFQMETTAAAPAAELVHICASVVSEGGDLHGGTHHYRSTAGTAVQANSVGTVYVVGALRLKATHLDGIVMPVAMSAVATTVDDFEWVAYFNPTVSGALSWVDVDGSACQYAAGDGAQTVTGFAGGRLMQGGFDTGGSATSQPIKDTQHIGALVDGTRDVLVLGVRPLGANLDIEGGMTWRELQ
ncbi:MAG: hypothetical protein WBM50_08650 [Acidimicrobiales bacterium]